MPSIYGQIGQIVRRLRRAPLFTVATVVTIAAAVGANTAVFSVVEGILLKPLRYPGSERLISIRHTAAALNLKEFATGPSQYFIYREQGRAIQDIGLYDGDSASVTGVAEPERVSAVYVTDGTLPILGVPPALGRWINHADASPGSPETVMLLHGYWQRKFGGDPGVIGRSIRVDGKAREIIGVMPQSFRMIGDAEAALLLPFRLDRSHTYLGDFSFEAVARLKPGTSLNAAAADLARLSPIVNRSFPAPSGLSAKLFEDARVQPLVRPLKQAMVGDISELLWVLMGSIVIVLLIACANVANLLLVRAEGRQQELAVRAALGAGRTRVAFELMLESLVLGALGGAAGLGLAYGALQLLVKMAPAGLPRLDEIGIDAAVLVFTLGITIAASLIFSAMPVFKYSGVGLGTGLREGARTAGPSRERHRARSVLVVVQVALALVLLISSGLMIRTFLALTGVSPGFTAPEQIQTLRLTIPESDVPDRDRAVRMHEEIARKLASIPGVSAVGMGSGVPLDGSVSRNPLYAEDHIYREGEMPALRNFKFAAPGYYGALGTPFIAGRDFTWTETYQQRPVVLVSENLAREQWGDPANALGKRVRLATRGEWFEVVGVVGNIHHDGLNREAPSAVTWPILVKHFWNDEPQVQRSLTYVVRTPRAGSNGLAHEIRQAVWSVNAGLPLATVRTLQYYYRQSMARTSFTLIILALAGGMALLLGIVGLYGVIAYSVTQRTREIGIRVALGARTQEVTGMFVRHGLLLTGAGVVCGVCAAAAVVRLMSSLLFKVSALDLPTYLTMSLILAVTTLAATYVPARRAAAVDPSEALRAE
jgi:predicted permease